MKKENNFLDLMGEIDEKFVYEASLPWKKRNVNLKLKLAKIAAAGVVIALLIGGLGHPHEIKAAWEQITSWIQTALGINENVESYIDSVGKTITKNGISITLDEIAADKENLWVAISDNINASKEKETILLTEVEINGKAAQLDGTYALEKKENGTDGQVCHYRLEDTTIKDNTADIKMKVTGQTVTPQMTCAYSIANGEYVPGMGTSHSFPTNAAYHWGLTCERVGKDRMNYVVQSLKEGKMVVEICEAYTITGSGSGHFIVLTGVTRDGYITIADCASRERTGKVYSVETIKSYGRDLSEGAFWIVGKK